MSSGTVHKKTTSRTEKLSNAASVRPSRFPDPWFLTPWFLAAAGLSLVSLCLFENHAFFHDDTYITLRYARHILAGYGPVWNTSGPRVEGFTSVLHLLAVTAVGALHVPLPTAARTINIASHLLLLPVVAVYLFRHTNRTAAFMGTLILSSSWMLIVWDLGGLDAVLFTALSTAGVLTGIGYFDLSEPRPSRSLLLGSILLAFSTLARPEGVLFLGGLWLCAAFSSRIAPARRWKLLAAAAGLAILILLPISLFRWFFFHQLLPNTFYAKIGGVRRLQVIRTGTHYFLRFLFMPPFLGLFALAAAVYALRRRTFTTQNAVLWAWMSLMVVYIILSGGDHMTNFRFFLPLVPLLTVALMQHLYQNGLLSNARFLSVFTPILLLALAMQSLPDSLNPKGMDDAARNGEIVGKYIHQHWRPGSIIALNTAGSTPYFADEMQYIDMLGLNDATIARRKNIPSSGPWTRLPGHLKGDGASVLSRHPDYIILGPSNGTTTELKAHVYFIGDYEIGISPYFTKNYEPCTVTTPAGLPFTFYQRRDAQRPCPTDG